MLDKPDDHVHALTGVEIAEHERPRSAHALGLAIHQLK
jgi:hypothetical protein